MISFRNTTYLFFTILLAMIILLIAGDSVPPVVFILLFTVYFAVLFTASFFISSGFYLNAFCRLKTTKKVITLTFDDGPDPSVTPLILDILKDKATATFFCIGKKIDGNEEIIRRIDTEGHLIGTHSYSHAFWFDFYSSRRMKKEFIRSENMVFDILRKRPLLFRPPYGVINPVMRKAVRSAGYHVIGFSNRSLDTYYKNETKIFRRVTRKLKTGDVILFHDTVRETVSALEKFLIFATAEGYSFLRLDEFADSKAYA